MIRDNVPKESAEQAMLFRWAAYMRSKYPELQLLHHIPNGGSRNKAEAARLKAEGVLAGIPDVMLPSAKGGYHGLYIEMKRRKGGTVSKAQKECIEKLRKQGYQVEVCKGCDEAINAIEEYLNKK